MSSEELHTTCCIVGGGPAGVMLGYLLARAGVQVTVLEKHKDFNRDFRGDTVHPSTLEVLYELGLLDDFLQLPHQRIFSAGAVVGDFAFAGPDFRRLPGHAKFVAMMPQWDFLNFLSERAKRFPTFDLRQQHEATGLIRNGDRFEGVVARRPGQDDVQIHADLVVGCDGRRALTRSAAELELIEFGVPIDVLWFRLSRRPDDPDEVLGTFNYGKMMILINRGDYFQAGLIIRKGGLDDIQQRGLDAFRQNLAQIAPYLEDRVGELHDWDQIKLLTVQINRLRRWYRDGLLCIGDAAHAMSPAGGVGINLAIQDAVATANMLAERLLGGRVPIEALAAVQNRREFPARVVQSAQVAIHNRFARLFENPGPLKAPWQLKAIVSIPGVHWALGYAVGIGVRPEHVAGARRETRRPVWVAAVLVGACLGAAVGLFLRRRRSLRTIPAR